MNKYILHAVLFSVFFAPTLHAKKNIFNSFKSLFTKKKVQKQPPANKAQEYIEEHAKELLDTTPNNKVNIRVLLEKLSEVDLNNAWSLKLESEKGFLVKQTINASKNILVRENNLLLSLKKNALYIQTEKSQPRKVQGDTISLSPISQYLVANGIPYNGSMNVYRIKEDKTPFVVNIVNLDDYIYSVLRYETYQSWPKEMHKVQAIVSRTYALHHLQKSRKRNKFYDIKSNNFHQNYKGFHPYEHLKEAIKETHNIIVAYNNKPALTMFDACCGGIIPANVKGLSFKEAPYLARRARCNHCKDYKLHSWQSKINFREFMENLLAHSKLKNRISDVGSIRDIKIVNRDKAGLVHKVQLKGALKNLICSGRTLIESMKNKLRSLTFTVKKERNKNASSSLLFTGKGYGHQLGLCQRGAKSLVEQGSKFKEILSFYYPGTTLAKIGKESDTVYTDTTSTNTLEEQCPITKDI